MKSKEKLKKEKKVVLTGVVVEELPNMFYVVQAVFKHTDEKGNLVELPLRLRCSVSGKMKKKLIQLRRHDEVQVEVSLYDINSGVIVYRNTKRDQVV
ncbi:translation initiation factor IF-1 [Candidatus Dojkabacteria bacterium]|uniref:Translation initiation factor IF-1 n=1 Tax=Candidatus Dojkabacteria bacterium TaxID=2099670 RepID=A0A3M0YY84_9BACT|nr:MAG: translation initiation factor IF-1 [Candidatus Dojkabacteria bacterium]